MTHPGSSPALNPSFGLPQLPKTVPHRPRVVECFEKAFSAASLVLVKATPGSGKTSAAADWAASSDRPVAWIGVNGEEASSETMWGRILHSCQYLAAPGSSTYDAITAAIAEMESGALLPELMLRTVSGLGPVTLVLDDMTPSADTTFLKELVRLLGTLPLVRALLIYQQDLLPGQSTVLRPVDVSYIAEDQLYLTSEEVQAQIQASGSDLDPDLVFLHTYGFPVLVRSLLTPHREQAFSGNSQDIEALVRSWIRGGIPDTVRGMEGYAEFIVRTSIAETLTAGLAEKLTGRTDAAEVLRYMSARGLLQRGSGETYRFRRIVRLSLLEELSSHPEWLPQCRQTMIDHYVAAGMVPRALAVAVDGKDYAAAELIAARYQNQLLLQHPTESANILANVPAARMLRYPMLAMTAGLLLSRQAISRDRGMQLLDFALAGLEASGPHDHEGSRKFFPLAQMVALRAAGRSSEAVRALSKAVDAVEETCPERLSEVAGSAASIYIQAGLTLLMEGWTKEARIQLRRAASEPESGPNPPGQITCLGLLGLAYVMDGRVKDAEAVLYSADDLYDDENLDGWLHAPYLVAKALCAIERGAPLKALEILNGDGFELTSSELWPIALAVRGLAEMFVDPTLVNVDDMERPISGSNPRPTSAFAVSVLKMGLSAIHLAARNPAKAAAVLEGLDNWPHIQLSRARIALAEGDFEKAEKMIPADGAGRYITERGESQKLLMRAAIAGHAGRTEEAKALHAQAIHLNSHTGMGALSSILPDPALHHLPAAPQTTSPSFRFPAVRAPVHLTARERIVLKTLAASASAAVAARELGVSLNTIKAQSRSIYRKLNVSSLRDALAEARSMSLI